MNEIEAKFYETFLEVVKKGFVIIDDEKWEISEEEGYYYLEINNKKSIMFEIELQPEEEFFNGYRPDFMITINGVYGGYVIEIDGHEWHEKTKEQARADKEKERMYLKSCYIPVRFTGSEVYHNAKMCVNELFEIIFRNSDFFRYDELLAENAIQYDYIQYLENKGE